MLKRVQHDRRGKSITFLCQGRLRRGPALYLPRAGGSPSAFQEEMISLQLYILSPLPRRGFRGGLICCWSTSLLTQAKSDKTQQRGNSGLKPVYFFTLTPALKGGATQKR